MDEEASKNFPSLMQMLTYEDNYMRKWD